MLQSNAEPIFVTDPSLTTVDLLKERALSTPELSLFAVPKGTEWQDMSAAEFKQKVVALAKGLRSAGIGYGDRVGIISKVRFEWTLIDFAVWWSGAILVPLYETNSPAQILGILNQTKITHIFAENSSQWAKLDEISAELEAELTIWRLDTDDLSQLVEAGKSITEKELEEEHSKVKGSDLATIIFTSGSTGVQRGVELTHSNLVDTSRNAAAAMPEIVGEGSSTLLFVTLAHVFARFISVVAVHSGIRVGHQPDTSKLLLSLETFRPSFILAVPRVFEKVFNSAASRAEASGRGAIFQTAASTAIQYSKSLDSGKSSLFLKAKHGLFDKLVYSKLRKLLGNRAQYAISGSAPLGKDLAHFYRGIGVQILEGYGLTETTAPITVNRARRLKIGTVGTVLPGNSIRIDADGEIKIKGQSVMRGYFNNPEITNQVLDEDGWFSTGDYGSIDAEGYLSIVGRKKDLIITAGGKNVAPAILEDPIRAHPLVSQIVVVGDNRPFVAAMITLDAEMLPAWLENAGLNPKLGAQEAKDNPEVLAALQEAVDIANSKVSQAESIRKFVVLPGDFTVEAGHLTPKLSIKRQAILQDWSKTVEAIYS